MYRINVKQIKDQVRKHYKHISKCDDDHHCSIQPENTSTGSDCNCADYSSLIQDITSRLTTIENDITNINNYLSQIMEKLDNSSTPEGVSNESVTLSLNLPSGGDSGVRSANVSHNTVAFDSLLADVDTWDVDKLDEFYNEYISPVIEQNGYNLLAPIPVSELCSCTRVPIPSVDSVRWDDLSEDEYIENKRSYIMQFILANRSNQTRALYLTNKLIGAFALPAY
jgi:hypothetical protein